MSGRDWTLLTVGVIIGLVIGYHHGKRDAEVAAIVGNRKV